MKKTVQKKVAAVTTDPKTLDLIAKENQKMVAAKKVQTKPATKAEMKKKIDAAEKTLDAKKQQTKPVAKKGNGGFKANPNSKANKIRQMFAEKKEWTLNELTKRSGFKNDDNTRCMMSIFKNKDRTKELLVTEFDKEKQVYSLVK